MQTEVAAAAATQAPTPSTAYAMTVASTRELSRLSGASIGEVRRTYAITCGLPADGLTKRELLAGIALEMQKLIRSSVAPAA